ncbi:MAG: ATP-binding cassette domain-containing protein [Verrucomicrobiota bacterium]
MVEAVTAEGEVDESPLPDDVAIRVTDVWKRYRTGAFQGRTLVREMQSFAARLRGKEDPNAKVALNRDSLKASHIRDNEWFWAVKGASFEVKKGETIVILGRNGAGKSTLLQILCQVTEADRGEFAFRGRFASLLQAGVGFHEELTGRENIFLNGAILGLTREEIIERVPAIAEFSEIPQFLDTPVKRYSSGMRGRLGFSVAAHLGAEIMILDEVFATGDRVYRMKCIEKMRDLADGGTTVILVTHNVELLGDSIDRALYMQDGVIRYDGDRKQAMEYYMGISNLPGLTLGDDSSCDPSLDSGQELDEVVVETPRQLPLQALLERNEKVYEEFFSDTLKLLEPQDSILEVGCMIGSNLEYLRQKGFGNLAGVEVSSEAVKVGAENFPDLKDRLHNEGVISFLGEQEDGAFDAVFSIGYLGSAGDRRDFILAQMARVCRRMILLKEPESLAADPDDDELPYSYEETLESHGLICVLRKIIPENQWGAPIRAGRVPVLRVFVKLKAG